MAERNFDAALIVVWEAGSEPELSRIVHSNGAPPNDRLAAAFPSAQRLEVPAKASSEPHPRPEQTPIQVADSTTPVSFTRQDCELFERTPPGTSWRSLSEADIELGRDIRGRLKILAQSAARTYRGTTTLVPHVSLHNQSGHPSQDLWCCVYPEAAGNKSYTLQVAMILSAQGVEICLCLGAGASSIGDARGAGET